MILSATRAASRQPATQIPGPDDILGRMGRTYSQTRALKDGDGTRAYLSVEYLKDETIFALDRSPSILLAYLADTRKDLREADPSDKSSSDVKTKLTSYITAQGSKIWVWVHGIGPRWSFEGLKACDTSTESELVQIEKHMAGRITRAKSH